MYIMHSLVIPNHHTYHLNHKAINVYNAYLNHKAINVSMYIMLTSTTRQSMYIMLTPTTRQSMYIMLTSTTKLSMYIMLTPTTRQSMYIMHKVQNVPFCWQQVLFPIHLLKWNSDCYTTPIIPWSSNIRIWSCLPSSYYSRHSFFTAYFCRQEQRFTVNSIMLYVYIFPDFFVTLHNFTDLFETKVHLLESSL